MASNQPPTSDSRTALQAPSPDSRIGQQTLAQGAASTAHGMPATRGAEQASETGMNGTGKDAIQREPAATNHSPSRQARRKIVDRRSGDDEARFGGVDRRADNDRRTKGAKASGQKAPSGEDKPLSRQELKVQQHRKKILLAGCEPVMGLNYDTLAMDDYPSNELVASAKKDRDQWVAVCSVFSSVFLFGFTGIVPPLVAGISCGAAMLAFVLAFTPLRTRFFDSPSLSELLEIRKRIEFRALTHIQFLEGPDGLAWRCEKMGKYNSNLNRKLFRGMILFSKSRNLMDVIRNRKQIRLYLLYMIEAQKAYKRLQRDYLESHFKHLDQGWDDSLSEDEATRLEKEEGG